MGHQLHSPGRKGWAVTDTWRCNRLNYLLDQRLPKTGFDDSRGTNWRRWSIYYIHTIRSGVDGPIWKGINTIDPGVDGPMFDGALIGSNVDSCGYDSTINLWTWHIVVRPGLAAKRLQSQQAMQSRRTWGCEVERVPHGDLKKGARPAPLKYYIFLIMINYFISVTSLLGLIY